MRKQLLLRAAALLTVTLSSGDRAACFSIRWLR